MKRCTIPNAISPPPPPRVFDLDNFVATQLTRNRETAAAASTSVAHQLILQP